MRTYKHSLAYRWPNGDVEGFVGYARRSTLDGATDAELKAEATTDAIAQIKRKAAIVADTTDTKHEFNPDNIINDRASLTDDQWETVKRDWLCGLRY